MRAVFAATQVRAPISRSKVNYDPLLNIRGRDGLVYRRLLQGPITLAQVMEKMPGRIMQVEMTNCVIDTRADAEAFLEILKIAQAWIKEHTVIILLIKHYVFSCRMWS